MLGKNVIGIIPARFASTRLPGKPLISIMGKPLIQHVWESASESVHLSKVIVATDNEQIYETCQDFGADCIMTSSEIKSGSDRIISVIKNINEHFDFIVNLQGDEPLISGELIDELIIITIKSQAEVGTVIKKIDNIEELFDSNVVKVVLRDDDTALYFSRSPIPFNRENKSTKWLKTGTYWKHVGVYCYTHQSLLRFGEMPRSHLEKIESLEQLRLMENGARYICLKTDLELHGVDTPADVEKVEDLLNKRLS